MPGHIAKLTGPDPDPSPWLIVSPELKIKLKAKPYDPKKSVWVPTKDGGYLEGLIESEEGKKVTVKIGDESKVYKKDQLDQVNPPKFDCSDDMADLTYLGNPCVLWNSIVRYINELIYTYSGLFCIAINPYVRYPIYTLRTMELYVGKRRNECPPHIFAIAEGAYQGMNLSGINQSILITGESGAGKTENTKKVISYFATICSSGKRKEGEASLEDKIVQTNPVLEAWGNAKTVRNDNSSRFGKFIRIHFNQAGKLSGADMVVYLLEKSRLTYQQPLERCYHAFYNLMSDFVPDLKEKCLLSDDITDYWFVSQGKLTVPSINDKEDMQFADEAFDILGFSEQEKYDVFKNTACMMHMGNFTKDFVPVGKEEQAEIKDDINAGKVATLCGIDTEWMVTYFCKPKLKVGTEWVQKGNSCSLASSSVAGIARAIYERTFRLMVEKCNETLIDPSMKKAQYIGVLDIAGFEIFDFNGYTYILYYISIVNTFFLFLGLNKFASIMSTKNSNSSSISICSPLNKRSTLERDWTGQMWILEWTCKNVLTCLRNLWAFCPSLKKNPFSLKLLIKPLPRSFTPVFLESGLTLENQTIALKLQILMLILQCCTTLQECPIILLDGSRRTKTPSMIPLLK